jgi:hypothetical protein
VGDLVINVMLSELNIGSLSLEILKSLSMAKSVTLDLAIQCSSQLEFYTELQIPELQM